MIKAVIHGERFDHKEKMKIKIFIPTSNNNIWSGENVTLYCIGQMLRNSHDVYWAFLDFQMYCSPDVLITREDISFDGLLIRYCNQRVEHRQDNQLFLFQSERLLGYNPPDIRLYSTVAYPTFETITNEKQDYSLMILRFHDFFNDEYPVIEFFVKNNLPLILIAESGRMGLNNEIFNILISLKQPITIFNRIDRTCYLSLLAHAKAYLFSAFLTESISILEAFYYKTPVVVIDNPKYNLLDEGFANRGNAFYTDVSNIKSTLSNLNPKLIDESYKQVVIKQNEFRGWLNDKIAFYNSPELLCSK